MEPRQTLYEKIANDIEHQINSNVLKIGDHLPSLRSVCRERGISMNTALKAFHELEARGLAEAKPRSGFVVSYSPDRFRKVVPYSQPRMMKGVNHMQEIMELMVENFNSAEVWLSSATLSPELVPIKKLNAAILKATQTLKNSGVIYDSMGSIKLKTQIAKRAMAWGGKLKAEEIVTTAGSIDAIAFCLMALTQRGDSIAVESPVYFGILRLANHLGLNVIEMPTHPVHGVEPDFLEKLMKQGKIKLCVLVSNFGNPLGSSMPDENKRNVVLMAEKYGVPIVEDDVYGELFFDNRRPLNCKTFDQSGVVLWCGSFSKTLVSGYRVGWIAPGKFQKDIERVKLYHTLYCSTIPHEAVGIFLETGRYDLHLQKLRKELYRSYLNMQRCISESFPQQTSVTHPRGGMNIWVQFPQQLDALELYNKAIMEKISITPGRVYTLQNQYNNCIKLSFGLEWNNSREEALRRVGVLAQNASMVGQ